VIVVVPGLLRSYTKGIERVELPQVETLRDVLDALNERYPGMRFRLIDETGAIRRHVKLFVDSTLAADLSLAVHDAREVMIVGALSGG
jgi:sulfur-carrier protein